jgi:hypothetical protein
MTEEARQRLAEHAKKKRGVILKDILPGDLVIAVDWIQEDHPEERTKAVQIVPPRDYDYPKVNAPCYLKYATPAQIEALAAVLPHCRKMLPTPNGKSRPVVLFDGGVLRAVLCAVVGTKEQSYWNSLPGRLEDFKDWVSLPEAARTPPESRGGVTRDPWWGG